VVRMQRDDQRGLPLQVELDLARNGRASFPNGRPAMMTLVRTAGTSAASFRLTVRWGPPSEVVFVSGQNPRLPELFRVKALHRYDFMLRRREIPSSCVLTLFHCERILGPLQSTYRMSKATYLPRAPGGARQREPAGRQGGRRSVQMTNVDLDSAEHHVRTVYAHLAEAGNLRPRLIREFGFLGHAYWMGAVMFNTGRLRAEHDDPGRLATDGCHDQCPTDRAHAHLQAIEAPSIRDGNGQEAYGLPKYFSYSEQQGGATVHRARLARHRHCVLPDRGLAAGSRQDDHERTLWDRDPRNTDFCDPALLPNVSAADLREALHPEGISRVWGCNNGIMGGAFRGVQRSYSTTTENLLIDRVNQRHGHGGSPTARQQWRVRQGDTKLLFLSRSARGYPAVLARALNRPCYGTVPGTYGEYQSEDQLGAMNAAMTGSMRRLAQWGLYPNGVPDGETFIDAGGYFRFDPNPDPRPWTVRVLITGFTPFGMRSINTSQNAVRALESLGADHVRQLLHLGTAQSLAPPWLDLTLEVEFDTNVDVQFSGPGVPGSSSGQGAGQILSRLQNYDADIVIIVGEAGVNGDFRLERFGRNWGVASPDNAGRSRATDGPTFPGRPTGEALESTIPLRAWLAGLTVLRRDGFTMENPPSGSILASAGGFICNESFYTLLLEARGGLPAARRPGPAASGRWVQMLHLRSQAANSAAEDHLGRGIGKLAASYVLSMTWAADVPGDRIIWDDLSARPQFPRYIATTPGTAHVV
ncbi:MAG: hypothetical protein AAF721_11035, partial [Myxococcota bacterium]